MKWETVIGLEIHSQLLTKSKIFSSSSTTFGVEPNTQIDSFDLGMPGTLPSLNEETVRMAVMFGLAIHAKINKKSIFSRKNYFYPDLPKGYQISQMDYPIVGNSGYLDVPLEGGITKRIFINRAHLEEDAGKSDHQAFDGLTSIDLNRSGIPLLEIVSNPDMRNAEEAVAYVKEVRDLVRYLGICNGNMEEGSLRCDCNVSVRIQGEKILGTRCELKNLNSFRSIERAINIEAERQISLLQNGCCVIQETRLYDVDKDETRSMRSKENSEDYRYFPEPDLLPLIIEDKYIEDLSNSMPELRPEKCRRFQEQYKLSKYDSEILSSSPIQADYFDKLVKISNNPKMAANWVIVELSALLNKKGLAFEENTVNVEHLGVILQRINDDTISGKIAKKILEIIFNEGTQESVDFIIKTRNLRQVTDNITIEKEIKKVIANHVEQVKIYRGLNSNKKNKIFIFLVGKVMAGLLGKASPRKVNLLLKSTLEEKS